VKHNFRGTVKPSQFWAAAAVATQLKSPGGQAARGPIAAPKGLYWLQVTASVLHKLNRTPALVVEASV